MESALFYIFAALTLVSGLMVIANPFTRNPVTSAMFLVATIGSLAGLFVMLHAFFLAAVQVLVYAGAVMVLFLFVIMLLDLRVEERRTFNKFGIAAGVLSTSCAAVLREKRDKKREKDRSTINVFEENVFLAIVSGWETFLMSEFSSTGFFLQ